MEQQRRTARSRGCASPPTSLRKSPHWRTLDRQSGNRTMANIRARLAHMGIYVHDRDRMERFYTEVLGLMVTDHGEGRAGMHLTFMSGNPENHHQMVLVTGRPDTSGFNPIQQMSFMVDSLVDLREVHTPRAGARRHRDAPGQPRQRLVDLLQGPGRQHGGGVSRHAVPRAAAARQAARPRQVGPADPARDRRRLPPGSGLHADRAVQAPDGRAARRRRREPSRTPACGEAQDPPRQRRDPAAWHRIGR